jgi:uncharacterized protein YkwD
MAMTARAGWRWTATVAGDRDKAGAHVRMKPWPGGYLQGTRCVAMHVRVLQVSTLFSALLATCTLSAGPLTPGEETSLLDGHNQIRADVANGQVAGQPSATNMTELVWDADLAAVASGWANNCTFAHNAKRSAEYQALSGNNDYVGENIYAQSNDSGVSDAALNAWFGEHTAYTYEASGLST